MRKLLGGNTARVVHRSSIPVFAVPQGYRRRPIRNIFYASDFNALAKELRWVRQFAKLAHARVIVCHYDYLADVPEVRRRLGRIIEKYQYADVVFRIQKFHVDKSLAAHIEKDMRRCSASLGVLFSDQKRGWFEKIITGSNAVRAVYNTTVPLLICPKNQKKS